MERHFFPHVVTWKQPLCKAGSQVSLIFGGHYNRLMKTRRAISSKRWLFSKQWKKWFPKITTGQNRQILFEAFTHDTHRRDPRKNGSSRTLQPCRLPCPVPMVMINVPFIGVWWWYLTASTWFLSNRIMFTYIDYKDFIYTTFRNISFQKIGSCFQ